MPQISERLTPVLRSGRRRRGREQRRPEAGFGIDEKLAGDDHFVAVIETVEFV